MYLKESLGRILSKNCSIQVFGLGYVGFPLSIRLATSGFKVIGIDTDSRKIDELKRNLLTTSQRDYKNGFVASIKNKTLIPSVKPLKSDLPRIGIICVPTPVPDGTNDSEVYVISALEQFLDTSKRGDIVILESSVMPGTTEKIIKIVKARGYLIGEDFGVCFCPERIDPLNQKWKLENIPRVIFSTDDITFQIAQKIYAHINNSSLVRVNSPKVAEVVKSFENAFRLVNISLVNELAILCDKLQINVNDVIEAASTKPFGFMSFSSGAGAGGHCIPKDPTFLYALAKQKGMNFSSIQNALDINSMIPKYIVDSIEKTLDELQLNKSVLVSGLTYKPDIEDMRDSAGFKILKEFSQRKFTLAAFDPYFKHELSEKYRIENHLDTLDFKILPNLDDVIIKNYDCICVVQNHAKTKPRIEQIYKKTLVPFIYDCQNKINLDPKSKTILNGFGFVLKDNYLTNSKFVPYTHEELSKVNKMSVFKASS